MKKLYNFETGQWITVRPEILTGEGIPYALSGENGDLYLDKSSGKIYYQESGLWFLQLNLTGPTGPTGPAGPTPLFTSGTFDDANVTINGDTVTISHDQGNIILPILVTDANGVGVPVTADKITFSNNLITLNLAGFTHSTSWRYAFGGGEPGAITENQTFTAGVPGKPTMYIDSITGDGSTVTATLATGEDSTGWAIDDILVLKGTANHDGEYAITAITATTISWASAVTALETGLANAPIYYKQNAADITTLNSQLAALAGRDFRGYDLTINIQQGYYDIATAIALLDIKNAGIIKVDYPGDTNSTAVRNNRLYIKTLADTAVYIRNASCTNLLIYSMTLESTANRTNMWYDWGALTIRECNIALLTVRFPSVIATSNNSCINVRANVIGEGRIESVYYEGGRQGIIGQGVIIASCYYGDPSTYPLYGVHAYYGSLFVDLTLQGATATKMLTRGVIFNNSGQIA